MASNRESKPSSKYADCVVGDDLEGLLDDTLIDQHSDYESPVVHHQVNGKINNVSFRTSTDRIEEWKKAIISFFGKENTTLLKEGTVIKVICDLETSRNNSIKINFYKTGAVVIQGAKCSQFNDIFFNQLKSKVNKNSQDLDENSNDIVNDKPELAQNVSIKEAEQGQDLDEGDNSLDSSLTFAKTLVNSNYTSTPTNHNKGAKNIVMTPKERINQHGQVISTKIENVNNSLLVIDSKLKSFINKLSEIKSATDILIPSLKSSIPELVVSNQKFVQIREHVENIDSKIKHCNQAVESIHIKLNILDTQLKQSASENVEFQEKHNHNMQKIEQYFSENHDSMESVISKMSDLQNRLDKLEQENLNSVSRNHNRRKSMNQSETESETSREILPNEQVQEGRKTECDYLILSDSVLRRIIPGKFTPNGKTVKRFIRGGIQTCANFVKNHGSKIVPKNILINIGTRDLRNPNGVEREVFLDLCETLTNMWPNTKIYFLPIIRRKDIPYDQVKQANSIIAYECRKFPNITLINNFEPTDDMFHDQAHLNNKKGLPAVVRHLKNALNMYPGNSANNSNRRNSNSYQNSQSIRRPNEQNYFPPPMMNVPRPPWIPPSNQFPPQWPPPPWFWPPMIRPNQIQS